MSVSSEKLTTFYNLDILPTLNALEEQRKEVLRRQWATAISIFLCWGFIGYGLAVSTTVEVVHIVGASAFVFLFYIYVDSQIKQEFVARYKASVITPLIHQIDPNLVYEKDRRIPERTFADANLFFDWTRYFGDDYVSGKIHGVSVEFSELNVVRSTKHVEKEIFTGIFFVCEFNKNLEHDVQVCTKEMKFPLTNLVELFTDATGRLENKAFMNYFKVYGSDEITTRYVLTFSMMEKLVKLKKKMHVPLYVSFRGSKFYLALDYNDRRLFEPNTATSLRSDTDVHFYADILTGVYEIIEDLGLNEYLWDKKPSASAQTPHDITLT